MQRGRVCSCCSATGLGINLIIPIPERVFVVLTSPSISFFEDSESDV